MSSEEPLSNVAKAFELMALGCKVFPVNRETRQPFKGTNGFYDATSDDSELVATWFTFDYTDDESAVAVWTGASGLIVADFDRKNGKNGFTSMKQAGNIVNDTYHHRTKTGGEHRIWQSDNIELGPGQNVLGMEGVDIRAGGSYIVWWGDSVPASRDAFSAEIPDWVIEAATPSRAEFEGEGFSGTAEEWLNTISDEVLPSNAVRDFLARIPSGEFGHKEMTDLTWAAVRMGSSRETGVRAALQNLKDAWLRPPFNTPRFRRDFNVALQGAINKAGRIQNPTPAMLTLRQGMARAEALGAAEELKRLEAKVSETSTEIEFALARRAMFKAAAEAGLSPAAALGIVCGSKSFKRSKVSVESVWFGDGEPQFQDKEEKEEKNLELAQAEHEEVIKNEMTKLAISLAEEAAAFSFLTEAEMQQADAYQWWGKEYLGWVKGRLKHFNKPYHVGTMWAVLSTIASPWGKVPLPGAKPTDCNLYINILGESTSGKSESWSFGTAMIDAYYGTEQGVIIGDINKLSALALHRALIMRDGKPSLVYGDEVQSFFQGVATTQWQNGVLGDISSHYGGDVSPKLTLNDKEISGKRAKALLTVYLTGIADQTLEAINIGHWTNGFFYRFLWGFGNARTPSDFQVMFESASSSYTKQFEDWAREFKRIGSVQEMKYGLNRIVEWEEPARERISLFTKQIDDAVKASSLYDSVFVSANKRFATSIMKCATLVAMSRASQKVTLDHVLVALDYAGPWHRTMVLAVSETGKEPFDRDVERCLSWIKRNAIRQLGKPAVIQRSAVMREFRPNEIAERILRQLTEEGRLLRTGDLYQIVEE